MGEPNNQAGVAVKKTNTATLHYPMLNQTNYKIWAMKMRAILNVHDVWNMIEPGTGNDAKKNNPAIELLFQSIPEELVMQIGNMTTAKEMWEAVKIRHQGADRVREARLQTLSSELDGLKMKDSSSIDEFATRISGIAAKSASLGQVIEESKLVKKFLIGLPRRRFIHMVASIEQTVDLKTITFDDIVGRLKAFEERIKDEDDLTENQSKLMFNNYDTGAKSRSYESNRGRGRGGLRGRGRGKELGNGRGSNNPAQNRTDEGSSSKPKKDRSQVKRFRCDEYGHFASACPERRRAKREANLVKTEELDPNLYMARIEDTVFLDEKKVIPSQFESETADTWYLDNGASNHMT
ncbi:uncharacterized protein LOC143558609 [Bidens hawaiensis]|uniref:uncharacterized protein LOC143558609 n=1 Tax=Bidens hawaiensis TaxID=980011 RepID=UPI004048EABF